jgi:hypothetical protein
VRTSGKLASFDGSSEGLNKLNAYINIGVNRLPEVVCPRSGAILFQRINQTKSWISHLPYPKDYQNSFILKNSRDIINLSNSIFTV